MNDASSRTLIHQVRSMSGIPFDESCVVIADNRLPVEILDALPPHICVSGGESLKTFTAVEHLAEQVLGWRATRPLTLVAVGGGSIGDAVGFLASILWRGVDLWHVPTTLLAMVDSAHGGKTAVNLGTAKNQAGTFHPAVAVYLVDEVLGTLPASHRREGMTELIKTLWLEEKQLADLPDHNTVELLAHASYDEVRDELRPLILRAIDIKMRFVEEDPCERRGIRTVLNLGHTLAHALELTTGLAHGSAVAWGLAASLEFSEEMGMPEDQLRFLRAQIYPLLSPIDIVPDPGTLISALRLDKKHQGRSLRSVVLHRLGSPIVTDGISAEEWIDAFSRTRKRLMSAPARISFHKPQPLRIELQAGKSELNRGLLIAALRPGDTVIAGMSDAADVRWMLSALRGLGYPVLETPDGYSVHHDASSIEARNSARRDVYCGEGGTTFRFLLAAMAMDQRETRLHVAPALFRRPHRQLIEALTSAGAAITGFSDGTSQGFNVRGWKSMPQRLEVDASQSSQYASALAMLAAASEAPFTLRLTGTPVSMSYFRMTLAMLERAGVEIIAHGSLFAFNPTSRLHDAWHALIPPDASSAAIWQTARHFGLPVELPPAESFGALQPDIAAAAFLEQIAAGSGSNLRIDLRDHPDLLPVLAVAAVLRAANVQFTGIAHLRSKESDRLEGLAASLRDLGHDVQASADSLQIGAGTGGKAAVRIFRTQGDHRLVMAACIYALKNGPVIVDAPFAVSKSYPQFLADARRAGWRIEWLETKDDASRAATDRGKGSEVSAP